MALPWEAQHLQPQQKFIWSYERTAITAALHSPKVFERFVDDVYSILKRTQLENFFHHVSNLHQNIKYTMEEESNRELAFLDTLLKWNNVEISVLVYRKPAHTNTYTAALTSKQVAKKVLPPPCLIEHILLSQIK